MKYRFKKMYIEITNVCNLDCDFCPKNSRKPKFMTLQEFDIITDKLTGFGKYLYFHVMGEPFLHPDLGEFLALAEKKDFKVNITTNGTLIKNMYDILLQSSALRQINFSLHSFDANTNEYNVESYLQDIINFTKKAASERQIYIAFRLWNLEDTKGIEQNKDILKFLEKSFDLGYNLENELSDKNSIKISDNIYLNLAQKFDWPDINGEDKESKAFCYGLRDQIGILADGTVIPCCLDSEGSISLGNIFEQSLQEIIESDRVKAIYAGFSQGKAVEELCKRCGYRTKFNISIS